MKVNPPVPALPGPAAGAVAIQVGVSAGRLASRVRGAWSDAAPRPGAEIDDLIDHYRRELVSLRAPQTLLRHHVRRLGIGYLLGQVYLEASPREPMRNHASSG